MSVFELCCFCPACRLHVFTQHAGSCRLNRVACCPQRPGWARQRCRTCLGRGSPGRTVLLGGICGEFHGSSGAVWCSFIFSEFFLRNESETERKLHENHMKCQEGKWHFRSVCPAEHQNKYNQYIVSVGWSKREFLQEVWIKFCIFLGYILK